MCKLLVIMGVHYHIRKKQRRGIFAQCNKLDLSYLDRVCGGSVVRLEHFPGWNWLPGRPVKVL